MKVILQQQYLEIYIKQNKTKGITLIALQILPLNLMRT